jgi:hypothetical protein
MLGIPAIKEGIQDKIKKPQHYLLRFLPMEKMGVIPHQ